MIDSLESTSGVKKVLELIDKSQHIHGNYQIFMSYSWDRKEDADYVEAFLRRDHRITLFRDEDEIKTGEPISDRIKAQLESCDVFLILWCAEYTTSPNCYDELQLVAKRTDCMIYVLRLDDTRPVWPILRKLDSHDWNKKWPEPPKKSKDKRGVVAASLNEMRDLLAKRLK